MSRGLLFHIIPPMFGRGILIAAIATYLTVLGCVMLPSGSSAESGGARVRPAAALPAISVTEGLPFRGAGMQIQRVDWLDKYEKSMDEIAEVGADTVLLVVDARQENGGSSRIYLDMRMTPSPQMLARLIQHAKKLKLRVVLMPIVLLDNPKGNEWRGTLKPESWTEWWDSYREMITHFAWIAQGNGVDVLVIGSELVSTENQLEEWTKTINKIREVFKGRLTYSANWDHYTSVPFWDQLDLISMNSYYKLGKDHNVSVDEIVRRWKEIQNDQLNFTRKMGKPLLFTEVGWCSLANAAHEPWDYTQTTVDIDLDLQKRLYEGFFRAWDGVKDLGGFMIWEWPPGEGGPDDRGYTPEGKPAEKVLREWLAHKS